MGGLWRLGNEMDGCSLTPMAEAPAAETVEVLDTPGLQARVVFHGADADREASLGAGATGLTFTVVTGAAQSTTRTVSLSLAVPAGAALTTSEPAGSAVRPAERLYTPTFWPAVGWAQVGGVAVLLRQSTGVRMSTPGALELMAVRDARTEMCDVEGGTGSDTGTHRIEWRLEPASSAAEAEQLSQAYNRPLDLEVVPLDQASTLDLPRQASLLGVSGAGIVSALKPADRGGGVILRVLLLPGPVTVTLPPSLQGKAMTLVDVAERDGKALGTSGPTIVFDPASYGALASGAAAVVLLATMTAVSIRSRIARSLGLEAGQRVGVSFAVRTTCAAVASLLLSERLHIATPIWAVVSAVVVIQPEVRASISSAALRVIANLVGAGAGMAVSLLGLPLSSSLVLGLLAGAGLSRLLGVDVAARTASVAVVIVLLKDPNDVGVTSETRVALVILGCMVALVTTVIVAGMEAGIARMAPASPRRGALTPHPPRARERG